MNKLLAAAALLALTVPTVAEPSMKVQKYALHLIAEAYAAGQKPDCTHISDNVMCAIAGFIVVINDERPDNPKTWCKDKNQVRRIATGGVYVCATGMN